jgi:hypothetical protein
MVSHVNTYSSAELESLVGSLKCVSVISKAFCLFGFIELVESSYIVVVTKATVVACIHGYDVYTITETNLQPITYKVRNTMEESRYKSILLNLNLANSGFYFSYTFDLTRSLQQNITDITGTGSGSGSESKNSLQNNLPDKFIWNHFALMLFLKYNIEMTPDKNTELNQDKNTYNIEIEEIRIHHICMVIITKGIILLNG